MGLRQTTLSPLLRSFGALMLVVYVVAQTLCFLHCSSGGGHGDSTSLSCHAATARQACHACPDEGDSSSQRVPSQTTTCSTLMNISTSGEASTLVVPDFPVLYFLTPVALALDATASKPEAIFSRQANHSDWVLTPEVSLGPAFRSLAPPSLI